MNTYQFENWQYIQDHFDDKAVIGAYLYCNKWTTSRIKSAMANTPALKRWINVFLEFDQVKKHQWWSLNDLYMEGSKIVIKYIPHAYAYFKPPQPKDPYFSYIYHTSRGPKKYYPPTPQSDFERTTRYMLFKAVIQGSIQCSIIDKKIHFCKR